MSRSYQTLSLTQLVNQLQRSSSMLARTVGMSECHLIPDGTKSRLLTYTLLIRYAGKDPEPRPGLPSGHIPHSLSLPFTSFLKRNVTPSGSTYTTFLPVPELRSALVNALGETNAKDVLEGRRKIVASCGSGMTAGVLWLGLRLLGVEKPALYDEVKD